MKVNLARSCASLGTTGADAIVWLGLFALVGFIFWLFWR